MATPTDDPFATGRSDEAHIQLGLGPMSAVWVAVSLVLALLIYGLFNSVPDTLTRLALGSVLAFALDPIVVRVRSTFGCSRGAAVTMVGLLATIMMAVVVLVIGPPTVRQAQNFSTELPQTIDQLVTLPIIGPILQHGDVPARIQNFLTDAPSRINSESIGRLVSSLVGGLVSAITVVVVAVVLLFDGDTLVSRARRLVPANHREGAVMVGRVFRRTIGAYFAGSLLVAGLAATFVLAVGLVLHVPLAPAAALWVLVVNLIPQVGGLLGIAFFSLLGLAHSPTTGFICLLLYLVYMNIENHILQPLIIGNAVDLSAAATMLAALIGGAAAGVPGAVIATPLAGTIKALYIEIKNPGAVTDKRPHHGIVGATTSKIRALMSRSARSRAHSTRHQ